jgi:hypothetical protein
MATEEHKVDDVESTSNVVDNDEDNDEKVIQALRLVKELEALGFTRPRFNLESPYSRRTVCTASHDEG